MQSKQAKVQAKLKTKDENIYDRNLSTLSR